MATHPFSADENKPDETNTTKVDSTSMCGAPQERAVNKNQTI